MSSVKESKKRGGEIKEKKERCVNREWSLINYTPEIRLPWEFNELNILSRRYIRLTYNKYDLARGNAQEREFFANGRKIRR